MFDSKAERHRSIDPKANKDHSCDCIQSISCLQLFQVPEDMYVAIGMTDIHIPMLLVHLKYG